MKHLSVLEDRGILRSEKVKSPAGPERKMYYLNVHVSLDIYLSNNSYRVEFKDHNRVEPSKMPTVSDRGSRDAGEKVLKFAHELERCINTPSSKESLKRLSELNHKISNEILEREMQRDMLLKIQSAALRVARQIISQISEDYTAREILHYYVEMDRFDVITLSDELDLRVKIIERVLRTVFDTE